MATRPVRMAIPATTATSLPFFLSFSPISRGHTTRMDDGRMAGVVEDGMEPNPARVKLTSDDFLLFPDDGRRHELIDGEHYVTPSPNVRHPWILGTLHM